jgi:hypothetical protein
VGCLLEVKCPSVRVRPLESGSFVSRHCRLSLLGLVLGHIDGFTLRSLLSSGMTPCGLVRRYHRLGEIYGLLPPAAVEAAGSSETLTLFFTELIAI